MPQYGLIIRFVAPHPQPLWLKRWLMWLASSHSIFRTVKAINHLQCVDQL